MGEDGAVLLRGFGNSREEDQNSEDYTGAYK
jgi:hypothetical protein